MCHLQGRPNLRRVYHAQTVASSAPAVVVPVMQTIEDAGTAKNPGQLVQSEGTERIMYSSFIIYLSKNVSKMRQYEIFTDITKV